MRYLGGKSKIAKPLTARILELTPNRKRLVEPFIGGGAMTSELAPHFEKVLAYDVHEDLVLMWQAVLHGWVPPSEISEQSYARLKSEDPSALRGFAGFGGASWGGKWFGGYARGDGRNYADESSRALVRQAAKMGNVTVSRAGFLEVNVQLNDVIYCDPPYAGTTGYESVFNSEIFWITARSWVEKGADVFVSEYAAPEGWLEVWAKTRTRDMKSKLTNAVQVTEKLFHLTAFD